MTLRRHAFFRQDAEETAGRNSGVIHQLLEIFTRRESLPQLPGIDRGNRQPKVLGNLLQRDIVLRPPVAKGGREVGADVALYVRLLSHGRSLRVSRALGKRITPVS